MKAGRPGDSSLIYEPGPEKSVVARKSSPNPADSEDIPVVPDPDHPLTLAHPGKSLWHAEFLRNAARALLPVRYRMRVSGHGNIAEKGPVLVLAKHQRLMDIPLGLMGLVESRPERVGDIWTVMKDSLVGGVWGDFLLRCGGIPLNRGNPEKSKYQLLFARERLHEGRVVVIFPEQTFFPWKMGKGRTPGFRFVAGKPVEPIAVHCVGFEYSRSKWPRVDVQMRIGPASYYSADDNPDHFLHERMEEMAGLSGLKYNFPKPEGRRSKTIAAELD